MQIARALGVGAALAAVTALGDRSASTQSANELLTGCQVVVSSARASGDRITVSKEPTASICWGFMGAMQELSEMSFGGGLRTVTGVCLPSEITRLQLIRVFLSYAQAHPEKHHHPASQLVLEAWTEAFPCKR